MAVVKSDALVNNPTQQRVTKLLEDARQRPAESDRKAAVSQLFNLIYDELHAMASRQMKKERANNVLQPTALVNETYLKVFGGGAPEIKDRKHFFGVASAAMRHVLIDLARTGNREKRGGEQVQVPLEDWMRVSDGEPNHRLDLQRGIEELARLDPRSAQALDMNLFGLKSSEIAELLHVSSRVVERDLVAARLFLERFLRSYEPHP